MMQRLTVVTISEDEVVEAGLRHLLRLDSDLHVLPGRQIDDAEIAVVGAEKINDASLQLFQGIQRDGCPRVLCVVSDADAEQLATARANGASGVLIRSSTSGRILVDAVKRVARGLAVVPEELVDALLVRASGVNATQELLSDREISVLRLLADGETTAEIGGHLAYSERTVKGIVHTITTRLGVRNRSHAVAHALRAGMI